MPRLDTDHRQTRFGECAEKPLRQRTCFQPNPLEVIGGICQHRQQSLWFARYPHFPNDPARVIHNADAGRLDRYVQSSKIVNAALLLLMLEAVHTDLVEPSARSAAPKIFSYPQDRRPITPSLPPKADIGCGSRNVCFVSVADAWLVILKSNVNSEAQAATRRSKTAFLDGLLR
jgi:hypothetical protein